MRYQGTRTERLDRIEHLIRGGFNMLEQGIGEIMTELSDQLDSMEANAESERQADVAAKDLIVSLGKLIVSGASGTPDAASMSRLKAIGQGMVDRAGDLSAAVVAGTPAAPGGSTGGVTG